MAREFVHPQVVAVIIAAISAYGEATGARYRLRSIAPAPPGVRSGAWAQSARWEPQWCRSAFYARPATARRRP